MSFTITSAKLTGAPDASGWAQVHEFKPEDGEKLKLRGHLFAVIATSGGAPGPEGLGPGGGIDSVVAGRELLARLHEEYFGKTEVSAFAALKASLTRVIEEFSTLWGDVEIAAVSILGDVVYVAAGGGAQVVVFRDGMLAKILVSEKGAVVNASGYPRPDDILLLATSQFFKIFPEGIVKAAVQTKEPASAVEALAPTLHTRKSTGNLGVALLKFEKKRRFLEGGVIDTKRETNMGVLPDISRPKWQKTLPRLLFEKLVRKLPDQRIYVRGGPKDSDTIQARKLTVSVGAILLLLLFVSIFFGIRQKRVREARERYEPKLVQARHELEEAIDLFSLNPARARQLFTEARQKVEELQDAGIGDSRLLRLAEELAEKQETVLGEYSQLAELFLDLSLLSDGFDGDDMAGAGDKFFVIDTNGEKVIGISVDTKRSEVVAGPDQIENADSIAAYTDRVFVVTPSGVDELGEEKKQVVAGDLSGEVLAYGYAGNLYVLDRSTATIWRHTGIEGGFGSRKSWFVEGIEPDLSRIISWTIDGAIWLLDDSGTILKFSFGNPQNFRASGVIPEFIGPTEIYTDEELEFLYVLEPSKDRVVVLDKSGDYKAQYLSENFGQAIDLVVSEKFRKIILLTGDKLYSIDLRHL